MINKKNKLKRDKKKVTTKRMRTKVRIKIKLDQILGVKI
jgi:hypothetical protein